jgi:murein DD-endopeptidase MepM/ murein hydrolase activator NlpD
MSNGFDPRIPEDVLDPERGAGCGTAERRRPKGSPVPFIALALFASAGLGALMLANNAGEETGAFVAAKPAVSDQRDVRDSALQTADLSLPPFPAALDNLEPLPAVSRRFAALQRRQTLSDLLDELGAPREEANAALYALFDRDLLDPRRLKPGLGVEVVFHDDAGAQSLRGLVVRPEEGRALTVSRRGDGEFIARETRVRLEPEVRRVAGTIDSSLYAAALAQGASDQQVVEFAQIFAYDVDFQREIRSGDRFEIVFEAMVDERGRPVQSGEILYAELNGRFTDRAFYRFTPSDDGITDYFDGKGESARKFLMKTPINGARLSSRFGMRRHPISGYSRMHKGTDFAAPTGTPVYAAGNGVVERASRYGGYGKYVRIQHANDYETAYAHLSRYGPGVKKGRRVKQGDIIGYVGSTGASTGPHLHYEVLIDGKQVDAMSLKLPTGRKLDGGILEEFEIAKARIDGLRGLGAPAGDMSLAASVPGDAGGGLPN